MQMEETWTTRTSTFTPTGFIKELCARWLHSKSRSHFAIMYIG